MEHGCVPETGTRAHRFMAGRNAKARSLASYGFNVCGGRVHAYPGVWTFRSSGGASDISRMQDRPSGRGVRFHDQNTVSPRQGRWPGPFDNAWFKLIVLSNALPGRDLFAPPHRARRSLRSLAARLISQVPPGLKRQQNANSPSCLDLAIPQADR